MVGTGGRQHHQNQAMCGLKESTMVSTVEREKMPLYICGNGWKKQEIEIEKMMEMKSIESSRKEKKKKKKKEERVMSK